MCSTFVFVSDTQAEWNSFHVKANDLVPKYAFYRLMVHAMHQNGGDQVSAVSQVFFLLLFLFLCLSFLSFSCSFFLFFFFHYLCSHVLFTCKLCVDIKNICYFSAFFSSSSRWWLKWRVSPNWRRRSWRGPKMLTNLRNWSITPSMYVSAV